MLDTSPNNLRTEIEAAIKLRRRHTDLSRQLIERYAGSAYREDWEPDTPSHENHEFEYLVNVLPALVSANPRVTIKSRRPVVQRELVEAMKHGMNRWIVDVDLAERLEVPVTDAQFDFGVVTISLEALPGYDDQDDPPLRPILRRISPRRYFKDPQGGATGGRYAGHILIRDKDDMLKARNADGTAKYDREAVEALASPDSADAIVDDDLYHDAEIRVDRNQVVFAEVYIRETGMIHTIGFSSVAGEDGKKGGRQLRKPRRFVGHPHGPYHELGFYIVPDQVYPLPPLAATHDLVSEINAHAEQVSRDSDTARNLVLYDITNAGLGDALQNFRNGSVAGIPGFNRNDFAEVQLGGANLNQLDYIQRLRERIDRRSGLTDIMRGNVTGDGTATEAQLAAASANARIKFMQRRVNRFVRGILDAVGWLMYHSDSIVFPIPIETADNLVFNGFDATAAGQPMFAAQGRQEQEAVFYGGVQPGQEEWSYFDLELEIEPYSMEEVNEAVLQKRMETAFAIVAQVAQAIPQMPYVNWPELLDDYFAALNIPDGRKYINFDMLAQFMQMRFSAGQVEPVAGLDGAAPVDLRGLGLPERDRGQGTGQAALPGGGAGGQVAEFGALLGAGSAA